MAVEVDEGLVGNHAGERQAVERGLGVVIVAAVEMRVVFDREDLLEQDQAVEHGGFEAGGDGDHVADAVGEAGGEGQRDQAADGGADHGVQRVDPEVIEQAGENLHLVRGGDGGKCRAPGFAGVRIDGGRAGAAITAAEIVRADDEIFVRVERLAGADHRPPTSRRAVPAARGRPPLRWRDCSPAA